MEFNELTKELSQNFIEYAVAVNTDRAIPDAKSGLKPVTRRILFSSFDNGVTSNKPYVKNARIVGTVMGSLHPHGDSSIYGALVRLAQNWIMRYPLLEFHGNMGNICGDGPASMRYTESRLSKLAEEGMLQNLKKKVVDFMPTYDESDEEPVTLPSIFPNLLCNPNLGIGVANSSNWPCNNLREVAQAIYDYIDGKEPMIPGPDFPTGGIIINKNDLPQIVKTGRGTVKIRGKYKIEKNQIIFTEIPYGETIEEIVKDISNKCDNQDIVGIKDIHDETTNKDGIKIVITCDKDINIENIVALLFAKTNLQSSFSYNQVALVNKTPVELGLKQAIEIYLNHNIECLKREFNFDLNKATNRLEVVNGLLKALEDIDNIISLIKKSESSAKAIENLMEKYSFSILQAKAIIDMKLGRLANLEKIEIKKEQEELISEIDNLNNILSNEANQISIIRERLQKIVNKFGDDRRTELTQIDIIKTKEENKKIEIIPEQCVVTVTETGLIKRIPSSSYKTQRRNTKGQKIDNIIKTVIRTNTLDNLMLFSNKGKMYRIAVNDIPADKPIAINNLITINLDEKIEIIYSIYSDTKANYVLFVTKQGIIKKVPLTDYMETKKKTGLIATQFKDDDSLASVSLINNEDILIITKNGYCLRTNTDFTPTSRMAIGIKGIKLIEKDSVLAVLPIRNINDDLAIFTEKGNGKRIKLNEVNKQSRNTRGIIINKEEPIAAAVLVEDKDVLLINGNTNEICILASEISTLGKSALGVKIIKDNLIKNVTKI